MRLIDVDAISEDDKQGYGFFEHYDLDCLLGEQPTVEAIPVEFIKDLYKQAIEYRDRWRKWSSAWRRADEQAIGLYSVLQVWEDRNG